MKKIPIGKTTDLEARPLHEYEVDGKKILISRSGERYFATSAICTHEQYRLAEGSIQDTTITCAEHGAQYDAMTGAVKALPATRPLRVYQLAVENGTIYLIQD